MPISQKIRDLIYNAWSDGAPCLVATAGPNGPNISVKGSMLVFDDDHLAYWERSKRQALDNLGHDKRVIVIYANFKAQRDGVLDSGFLRFYGTAELHEAGPMREAIFQRLNKREQEHVGADKGIGVLIKIDRASAHFFERLRFSNFGLVDLRFCRQLQHRGILPGPQPGQRYDFASGEF